VVGLFEAHEFMTHFHLYIGQEGTGVPLMAALGPDDKIATHHRNHGHVLARGADPKLALAEILGRETGMNRGAGGTMHMSDTDRGFISTSAIVGGSISLATGAAFALNSRGGDAIAVGLFGDGALEEGVSYESLNLAALWDLPILYVCENNSEGALGSAGGGFPTSVSAVDDLTDIPRTFGIPVETVDGRDPAAVSEVVSKGVEHTRRRKGPFFIHVATARYAGTQPLWPTLPTGETEISMAWDESKISGEHEQW
jgi:TPP-dependent pyruvate/acetoin dehydrogenase alpha subunit